MKLVVCVEPRGPGRGSRAALRLAQRLRNETEIILLSAGTEGTGQLLPGCGLPRGRAVHVIDSALHHANCVVVGRVLAQAARHLQADVVLAGQTSDDEGSGLVPALVAHELGATLLCNGDEITLDRAHPEHLVIGVRSAGRRLHVAAPPPVVLSVLPLGEDEVEPAETTQETQSSVLSLAQIGLDPDSLPDLPDPLGRLERTTRKADLLESVHALVTRWLGG